MVAIRIPPAFACSASTGGRSGVQGLAFLPTFWAMPKSRAAVGPSCDLVANATIPLTLALSHAGRGEKMALRVGHALDPRFREDDGRECVAAHRLIDGY